MKKRLFVFLAIVATLMCLFAICASATTIDGIEYSLNSSEKTATVGKNQTHAGPVIVIPQTVTYNEVEYTVTTVKSEAFRGNGNITTIVFPSTITKLEGYTFSSCDALTSVYIDLDNLTYIGTCGLTYSYVTNDCKLGSNTINFYAVSEYGKTEPTRTTSVNWANLTNLGSAACQGLNIETVVIGNGLENLSIQLFRRSNLVNFTLNSNIETLGSWSFQGCTSLRKVVINSNSLTRVGASVFSACNGVEEFYIDLSKVTVIEGGAFCFSGSKETVNNTVQWYNLDDEKLVDLSSLEQLTGTNTFAGSNLGSADTIIWPRAYKANTLGHNSDSGAFRRANIRGTVYFGVADGYTLNIDRYAFGNENYIETVILGPNVTSAASAFTDIATLKTVVILADSFDITGSTFISNNASDVKLYYKELTTYTDFSKSDEIQYTSYKLTDLGRCGVGVVLTTANGEVVVDGFNHVEGSTEVVDATCTAPEGTAHICKFCATTISIDETAPALGHSCTVLVDIVYARYDADGYKVHKCVRCDETDSSTIANAIFEHKGYSYKLDGSAGISSEFDIDLDALNEYESLKSTTITFGVVIVSPKYLPSGTTEYFFDGEKVNADNGVVQVELQADQRKYSRLTCYVKGFDRANANHNALELIIAGYAYEDANSIQFMQKQYVADELSPCVSKVTKQDALLYTVTIGTVETKVAYDESKIKEFGVAE